MPNNPPTQPATRRIVSIDALRGADMLLLAGGAAVLQALASTCGWEPLQRQLTHAGWGAPLTCWDMVMPLFIFIVGAGMPFAFAKYRSVGAGTARILWRIARRCLLLFLLGMLVQGKLATADPARMSLFCNTLQAIAEGYLIAALCLLFGGLRTQICVCLGCLLAYWAALHFIPYAGQPAGLYLPQQNLAIWIDHRLQGHWQDGTPYSWILTALSFGALTLLGTLGGQIIRLRPRGLRTLLPLLGAAAGCLLAGQFFAGVLHTPLIKHIFTTSMTLWSAGWCFALLALFHLAFDFSELLHKLATPLLVFGSNAILAYLLTETPGLAGHSLWSSLTTPLFSGLARHAGPHAPFILALLSLLALYGLLHFLYTRRIFLRV